VLKDLRNGGFVRVAGINRVTEPLLAEAQRGKWASTWFGSIWITVSMHVI
jgi:hypothetical protein